jgi:Domain of unknown function (DUF4258)
MAGEHILEQIKRAAQQRVLYLPHAVRQMSHPDRMITPAEVEHIVISGEVIEDYPQDPRGPSCLLLGEGEGGRLLHVVCSPKDDYLAIITAYVPDPGQWSADLRRRR